MKENKSISYKNTLIYTIIASIISAGLLIGLAFKSIFDYVYLIAVVEVGIFIIIGVCLYKIITYDKRMERLREDRKLIVPFNECPDYYVKKYDRTKGDPYCSNEHRVIDRSGNEYLMKIYPHDVQTLPSTHNNQDNIDASTSKYEKFWLNELGASKELMTNKERCAVVLAPPTNPSFNKYNDYHKMAWTSVRGRCE
jgi:hypothetical protein